uniref:Reverse transcriptase Ty1/copia-type domain-containing protein n=1 Tax=Lactuca sativa TaxID=4236 RepID=A0A9R1V7W0_LACSA|nr:hypothetical protein LSAT_V11C600305890 [Lactuca sativa]
MIIPLFVRNQDHFVVSFLNYVDDIILTGLRKIKFFSRIEFIDIFNGVCLNKREYRLELLHEFGMLRCKHVKTPLDANFFVSRDGSDKNDSLIFHMLLKILRQYMHKPRKSHLNVLFGYLGSPGKDISITKSERLNLNRFVDTY